MTNIGKSLVFFAAIAMAVIAFIGRFILCLISNPSLHQFAQKHILILILSSLLVSLVAFFLLNQRYRKSLHNVLKSTRNDVIT